MKNLLKKTWPFIFFISILLILFYKVFFLGQVFYEGDNFHINIPEKYFLVEEIFKGNFPLWNPYLFIGTPYFADLNLGTLNPLNFLYFIIPVPRAATLIIIIDFFLIAVFQYVFLRQLKLSKVASSLGAVIFSFGGTTFNNYGNMTYFNVFIYIPLIFMFIYNYVQNNNIKWFFLLILVQFIQFVSGHPQITYYTMFFVCFYILFFSGFKFKKRILITLIYVIFPLLLSGVILIPFIEFALHANRPVGSIDYASWGNLTIPVFVTFFFPVVFGNHVDGNWWGPQWILMGYTSISGLVLSAIGFLKSKFPLKNFVISGIILSLLLAMGKLTPLFYIFYYLIPGWKFFRAPSGLVNYYTFFISILGSYGMEYLISKKIYLRQKYVLTTWAFFVLSLFCIFILIFSYFHLGFWESVVEFIVNKMHIHFLSHLLIYNSNKIQQIFITALWNIFFFALTFFLTLFFMLSIKSRNILSILILLISTLSLMIADSKVITSTSLKLYSNPPIPQFLSPVKEGRYRIMSLQINFHQKRENLPEKDFFLREAQGNINMFKDDNNIERDLYQARGLSSLVPDSYARFLNSYDNIDVTEVHTDHMSQEQLNLTGVRYIFSHEPLTDNLYNNIILNNISSVGGKYYAYENKTAIPRAYILEDPYGNEVVWKKVASTRLVFNVNVQNVSHFIISNWYYPGWKALVNGKEVKIFPYKGTFQEMVLPRGKSEIKIIYDPLSVKIGLFITLTSLFIWVLLFYKAWKRRTK